MPHPAICVDENVTFKLMKRMRGSLIAYPIDQEPPLVEEGQLLRVNEASALSVYSKLLLAGRNEVSANLYFKIKHILYLRVLGNLISKCVKIIFF